MRIAITGSAGFIGSYLVDRLKSKDYELILLDIQSGVNICNWDEVKSIKADVIIHLANKSFVPDSYLHPKSFYDVNLSSTLNMLELCRISNAKLIYFSSYVYGHPRYQPIDENHPIQAFNPYAQTKVICEEMCQGYHRDFSVPIVVFRPFNIYGKGQNEDFLIPTLIKQAKKGAIEIRDDRPKRDYIHVSDVVSAIEKAVCYKSESGYDVFNLGSGVSYSVKDVVEMVRSLFTTEIDYQCLNEFRPNEVMDTVATISEICKIGWKPRISLQDGLKMML
jgi:nucleoside-diphosphate-sugar epimerase